MAAMKQRVTNLKGSEYFPYPLYFDATGAIALSSIIVAASDSCASLLEVVQNPAAVGSWYSFIRAAT